MRTDIKVSSARFTSLGKWADPIGSTPPLVSPVNRPIQCRGLAGTARLTSSERDSPYLLRRTSVPSPALTLKAASPTTRPRLRGRGLGASYSPSRCASPLLPGFASPPHPAALAG